MSLDYLKLVTNPYNTANSKCRKGLMVNGPWDESIVNYIKKNQIKALYFNYAHGWKGNDYQFLNNLAGLEELDIIAG